MGGVTGETTMNHRMRLRFAGLVGVLLAGHVMPSALAQGAKALAVEPANEGYKLLPGPFEVRTVRTTIKDDGAKTLEILIRAPKLEAHSKDSLPLVVFSHGMGGSREGFDKLSEHWASHGYVVVHPTHSDSLELRRRNGEAMPNPKETLRNSLTKVNPQERRDDCVAIFDHLKEIEAAVPGLSRKDGQPRIDENRLGVAGHSAGAMTTMLMAHVKVRGGRTGKFVPTDIGDPRVKCAIVISGQGTTNRMFTESSWSEVTTPMIVFSGSEDYSSVGKETPASRREPFERAKPGDKYLVFIEGATHSSYQGKVKYLALLGEEEAENVEKVAEITSAATLAFLDAYLKSDESAKAYLASEKLAEFGQGAVEYKKK